MILTAIQTNELGQMMREHITCILRMEAVRLDLDWAAEFSPKQILSCCDRMIEHLDCTINFPPNVQRELICSPEFAPWLARLMALAGKTAADDGAGDAPVGTTWQSGWTSCWRFARPAKSLSSTIQRKILYLC